MVKYYYNIKEYSMKKIISKKSFMLVVVLLSLSLIANAGLLFFVFNQIDKVNLLHSCDNVIQSFNDTISSPEKRKDNSKKTIESILSINNYSKNPTCSIMLYYLNYLDSNYDEAKIHLENIDRAQQNGLYPNPAVNFLLPYSNLKTMIKEQENIDMSGVRP